jgi:hypothetical protein
MAIASILTAAPDCSALSGFKTSRRPGEPGCNDAQNRLEKLAGNSECVATCAHPPDKARAILRLFRRRRTKN